MYYIDQENYWRDDLDDREVMVSIECTAYNHEKYIRDALEGFVNQKTNFRFEAIIHDDASTDGTAAILREYAEKYPSIIKPIFETENQFSKANGSLRRVIDAHLRGKYIAMCEGDDYWTDPLKLQKQVDFLEANPDYGMCYAKVRYFIQATGKDGIEFGQERKSLADLLMMNTIPSPTVMTRNNHLEEDYKVFKTGNKWLMGDYPKWLYFMANSKIHFDDEIMAVYRVLPESACHSGDFAKRKRFAESIYDMKTDFNRKYDIVPQEVLENSKNLNIHASAAIYGSRKDEKFYYSQIVKPSLKIKIKHYLVRLGLKKVITRKYRLQGLQ